MSSIHLERVLDTRTEGEQSYTPTEYRQSGRIEILQTGQLEGIFRLVSHGSVRPRGRRKAKHRQVLVWLAFAYEYIRKMTGISPIFGRITVSTLACQLDGKHLPKRR